MPLPIPRGKQRDILTLATSGQHVVLGTAGSGKTTMAILRAAYLADTENPHSGKTLLVTFNKTLIAFLNWYGGHDLDGVDLRTFHRFARGYLASKGLMRRICEGQERTQYIYGAIQKIGARLDIPTARAADLFEDEFDAIGQHGINSFDEYKDASLLGSATSILQYADKETVWSCLEAYRSLRDADAEQYDWADIIAAAETAMTADTSTRMYRHIVVDEGQDFAPAMLRTLANAVPKNGSLTFFGDVAQQIYGRRMSWREAGLDGAGDPIVFEQNYRNSREIAQLGLAIARMPYYKDVPDMVLPTGKMPEGPKPTLVKFADVDKERAFIVQQAQAAARTQNVAILCATNYAAYRLSQLLPPNAIPLRPNMGAWNARNGIRYGTYHCAKGLEFDAVILPFCSEDSFPAAKTVRTYGTAVADMDAGSLLYVGVTRAKSSLIITHTNSRTHLLPPDMKLYTSITR